MRASRVLIPFAISILLFLISCQQSAMNESSGRPTSNVSTIDSILNIPDNFKPSYSVEELRDVSVVNASRKVVSIVLPVGLDRTSVELNFKQAVKDVYQQHKPDAIEVWGYKSGESIKGPYSIGHCTFAPYGAWERASEKATLEKYKTLIELNDNYFNPTKIFPAGTNITLKSDYGDVGISSSSEAWSDKYIIAKVPNGTTAQILDHKEFPLGGSDAPVIRYRVSVNGKGKKQEGWVHSFQVKPN